MHGPTVNISDALHSIGCLHDALQSPPWRIGDCGKPCSHYCCGTPCKGKRAIFVSSLLFLAPMGVSVIKALLAQNMDLTSLWGSLSGRGQHFTKQASLVSAREEGYAEFDKTLNKLFPPTRHKLCTS
jgi:hypothetical protein